MDFLIINERMIWFACKSTISSGALTIGSYLHHKGFSVRVIENNSVYKRYTTDDFLAYVEEHQPKVIGFSVNALNAYNSYRTAETLRARFPDKLLVAGGLQSYDAPEEMAEQCFDVVFKGDAELSAGRFFTLAREHSPGMSRRILQDPAFLSKVKEIKGLILNVDGERIQTSCGFGDLVQDLDELPFNNYDLINLEDYIKTKYDHHAVTNQVNFQRGCPYTCTFCKSEVIAQKFRNNSARYMVENLRHRYENFGLSNFFITDSNFTMVKPRIKEFCSLMVSTGLNKKINMMIQTSIAIPLSDEEIDMLQEAGVTMFLIGVERFGENNRKLIQKAGTGKRAAEIIKKLYDRNMKSIVNILVNFSFETEETINEEARLIQENLPYMGFLYINYLSPMPGTPIYDDELDPKLKRWYLRKEIAKHRVTYYDIAYLIEGPVALKLNVFGHSKKLIEHIRHFKEKYQWKGSLMASRLLFLKLLLMADMLLGKISYHIARFSPELEDMLFRPFKVLRGRGYKMLFNLFFARKNERLRPNRYPLDPRERQKSLLRRSLDTLIYYPSRTQAPLAPNGGRKQPPLQEEKQESNAVLVEQG